MKHIWIVSFTLACLAAFSLHSKCEEPQKVSFCELQKNPSLYNRNLIDVQAFVSHDFEDFTLFDPTCHTGTPIWIEYGGTRKSDTMYCCGASAGKTRSKPLIMENLPIPLLENEQFEAFDREIQPPYRSERYGSVVHAELVGRFFAGHNVTELNGETTLTGFGHMACCSLFVVQEVKFVDPQDHDDLDYGASPDQPDIKQAGCGYQSLTTIEPGAEAIEAQRRAEGDPHSEAFDQPGRVAADFLSDSLKLKTPGQLKLRVTRKAPGRIVYQGKDSSAKVKYMLVMGRPYSLSFYAIDPNRVAWVPLAAYRISCGKDNSVTRIK